MSSKSINQVRFVVFLILSACQSKTSNIQRLKTDTLNVEYSDFGGTHIYGIESRTLIKTILGDTTTFTYFDSLLHEKLLTYSLVKSKNGSYELLNYSHLGYVNTFLGLDSILLLKYEVLNPPLDGDGAVILSPELGKIASYSYSWGNSLLLTKYNGAEIPAELIGILFSDSLSSPHYFYQKDLQSIE